MMRPKFYRLNSNTLRNLYAAFTETYRRELHEANMAEKEHEKNKQLPESRVLIIYTGGTIGMQTVNGVPKYLPQSLRTIRQLNDQPYIVEKMKLAQAPNNPHNESKEASENKPDEREWLALPLVKDCMRRIMYTIMEYEPLLDSSDMTSEEWIRIAKDIHRYYKEFDGFVVLHGTDTMAYTASALSFMLEFLGKPVVVTGSQIPVVETRSDGHENLIGALISAGSLNIPEVAVYFNSKLFRGNRTSKVDNSGLNAFDSPNMSPLARFNISVDVDWEAIFRTTENLPLKLHTNLNRHVGMLRIFPSISTDTVRAFLAPPMEGVVLQTYGSGNMPVRRTDLLQVMSEAVKRGCIIVNCSQCMVGQVEAHYESGKILADIGVVAGSDMTVEAALTKLSYVLGRDDWKFEEKCKAMTENIRGELTSTRVRTNVDNTAVLSAEFIPRLASYLRMSSTHEVRLLKSAIFPPMLCDAANNNDVKGASVAMADYDGRTALHVASHAGHLEAVDWLINNGAFIHARDRWNQTPLLSAIQGGHIPVIERLRKVGAHVTLSSIEVGMQLCAAAAQSDTTMLKAWHAGGVDINATDYDGRTALHVASNRGITHVVAFLIENGADRYRCDNMGSTAVQDAKRNGHDEIVQLLTASK